MQPPSCNWSIAIFAARESISTLTACIRAAVAAAGREQAVIDVLVNGNRVLAEQAAALTGVGAGGGKGVSVRVWFIPVGDKAHAWNQYVHQIWNRGTAFFIDGYAEVGEDALSLLEAGLQAAPDALGATGVPTSGRSAAALRQRMLTEGGIHGNLFAIRAPVMDLIRQRGFRLPLGLYRTDSLIGAVLVFRLDPARNGWDMKRMFVHPEATWQVRPSGIWKPMDILAQGKRKLRQAQGILENRAVRRHLAVEKLLPEELPRTVRELVGKWMAACPGEARRVFLKHPLAIHAALRLKQRRDWSESTSPPTLMGQITQ